MLQLARLTQQLASHVSRLHEVLLLQVNGGRKEVCSRAGSTGVALVSLVAGSRKVLQRVVPRLADHLKLAHVHQGLRSNRRLRRRVVQGSLVQHCGSLDSFVHLVVAGVRVGQRVQRDERCIAVTRVACNAHCFLVRRDGEPLVGVRHARVVGPELHVGEEVVTLGHAGIVHENHLVGGRVGLVQCVHGSRGACHDNTTLGNFRGRTPRNGFVDIGHLRHPSKGELGGLGGTLCRLSIADGQAQVSTQLLRHGKRERVVKFGRNVSSFRQRFECALDVAVPRHGDGALLQDLAAKGASVLSLRGSSLGVLVGTINLFLNEVQGGLQLCETLRNFRLGQGEEAGEIPNKCALQQGEVLGGLEGGETLLCLVELRRRQRRLERPNMSRKLGRGVQG
mmetsp:Transcript_16513/g.51661  ORF Transcript_16513/g.51661 Transcript_16513/m.51661 type:complete len:394 (+) Transcript_16513:1278-2459(+)